MSNIIYDVDLARYVKGFILNSLDVTKIKRWGVIPIPKIPSGTRPFTGRDVTRPKSQKKGGRTLEEARAAGRVQVPTYIYLIVIPY